MRKLEQKVRELEEANRVLQEDIVRRRDAESRANQLLVEAELSRKALLEVLESRRKTETALRENEERLRLALYAANQGLYDTNVQTGIMTVSAEYARMLGYEPEELRETIDTWRERMHPDDRAAADPCSPGIHFRET